MLYSFNKKNVTKFISYRQNAYLLDYYLLVLHKAFDQGGPLEALIDE